MYLKKIIALGFKSFADKIVIPLDRGINGIVGPNGSGKSNVIDAVRWVMGEQNARNLRGKVATDIIFSGSANRKPQGMAEVTLVFDNSDESAFCPPEYRHEQEISLTRRLYADGQREYLINRKPCRLKDIVNFFTTTGLGGRSYSMIQQGQVDRILQAKPEDVRVILEEAAGTLSYKMRRDDALKKLQQTQENLARIEDILSELERQKTTLKNQMEKAQKWKQYNEELQEKEITLLAHNFKHFDKQLKKIEQQVVERVNKSPELAAKIAHLEAEQIKLQNELDASDPGLEGLRETVSSLREQIARAESTILNSDTQIDTKKARLTDVEAEINEQAEDLKKIESQMQQVENELREAQEKANELRHLIESFQEQVDRVEERAQAYQNQIDDLEDELKNIDRLLDNNVLRCEAINRERDKLADQANSIEEQLKQIDSDLKNAQTEVKEKEQQLSEVQEGLKDELSAKESVQDSLVTLEEQYKEKVTQRDELKEHYFDARARVTSLEELVKQASQMAHAVEQLREAIPDSPVWKHGLVADKITFNERMNELSTYAQRAIELWSERLVVDNLADLNELVRAAHAEHVGGFKVSVLSELEGDDEHAIKSWAQQVGAEPLMDYFKVDEQAPGICQLLSRCFILPSLMLGEDELKDLPAGVFVFTTQGILFQNKDEFYLGQSEKQKGILARKSELEAMQKKLKEHERELAACQAELDKLDQDIAQQKDQLRAYNEKLENQNQDVLVLMNALNAAKQNLQHKLELKKSLEEQRAKLIELEKSLVEELQEQGQNRIQYADEQERIRQEIEGLKDEFGSIDEEKNEVFQMHENRKLELAKIEARAQALQESYEQTRERCERMQAAQTRRYEEKARLEQEIEAIRAEHQRCLGEIEGLMAQREALEQELAEKREENAELLTQIRAIDAELKSLRAEKAELDQFVNSKNIEAERLKVALEGVLEQGREKYQLDLSHYEFEEKPHFDAKRAAESVAKLKKKIEGLGAINMMAIEEYEELMTRHQFITEQRDEVLNSIATLEEALAEIEETSKNKFLETFEAISAEFSNLFPILFPGGDACLQLTDAEDPLNAGVEILARLPGKKLQRMTLLSGGEKALTAISLIFALLKTKPTPFCFLDEVDAPLDEANVGRYNRVLETLSERFQFIVITHNRRTMEVLDTLFGVTMQEPGVSKIVGVDMQKDLPAHLKKAFKDEHQRVGATASP